MFKRIKKLLKISREYDDLKGLVDEINHECKFLNEKIEKLEKLEKEDINLIEKCEKLERILEYGRQDKITYRICRELTGMLNLLSKYSTYIYKDGKEFRINDLVLYNPTFSNTSEKYNIIVEDSFEKDDAKIKKKYAVDLLKGTYIIIKNSTTDKDND